MKKSSPSRRTSLIVLLPALVLVIMLITLSACSPTSSETDDDHEHEEEATGPQAESAALETGVVEIEEVAVSIQGFDHIPGGAQAQYDHYPPSSGPHYGSPNAPIEWGIYTNAVPPEVWVHNLEHSGIALLYNCPDGCPDTVEALTDWAVNAPESTWGYPKILMFPNDQIETEIVALAWGWQMDLDEFDPDALLEFYARHVDQGPEDVP